MTEKSSTEKIEKFKKLAKDIQFAMFTTTKGEKICSRPMTLQEVDENQNLWFFVDKHSQLCADIAENSQVNVAFADPGQSSYVSVVAQAQEVEDREKIKQLFNVAVKAWFPEGPEDPNIALIKCEVERVDYWDSPSSKAVQLYAFAKSLLTGERPGKDLGGHQSVSVNNSH